MLKKMNIEINGYKENNEEE